MHAFFGFQRIHRVQQLVFQLHAHQQFLPPVPGGAGYRVFKTLAVIRALCGARIDAGFVTGNVSYGFINKGSIYGGIRQNR